MYVCVCWLFCLLCVFCVWLCVFGLGGFLATREANKQIFKEINTKVQGVCRRQIPGCRRNQNIPEVETNSWLDNENWKGSAKRREGVKLLFVNWPGQNWDFKIRYVSCFSGQALLCNVNKLHFYWKINSKDNMLGASISFGCKYIIP